MPTALWMIMKMRRLLFASLLNSTSTSISFPLYCGFIKTTKSKQTKKPFS